MSVQTADPRGSALSSVPSPRDPLGGLKRGLLTLVPILQAVLTVAGAGAVIALLLAGDLGLPLPLYLFVLAVPALFALAAGASTVWTFQRTARGRVAAIIVDYLAFLTAFLLLLHLQGVFIGFGDLADVFAASLPWLAVALVAYLVGQTTEWTVNRPTATRVITLVRYGLLAVAGIGFLAAIDAVHGVRVELLRGLADPVNLGLAIASVVLLAFVVALWGTEGRVRYGATLGDNELLDGVMLISPNLLGFLGFFAGPLLFSLYVSLTDWDAFSDPVFLGFENYLELLSIQLLWLSDPSVLLPAEMNEGFSEVFRLGPLMMAAKDKLFWLSLRNISVFGLIAIPLADNPGALHRLAAQFPRARHPVFSGPSTSSLPLPASWAWPSSGSNSWTRPSGYRRINYGVTLTVDFLNGTLGLSLGVSRIDKRFYPVGHSTADHRDHLRLDQPVEFNSVIYLAGMQGIPADLYEAATIDGANRWQRFIHITIPSVSATTFFVIATTTILAFQLFTEVWVLTGGVQPPGGPNNATMTPALYLYNSGFQNFEFGYASAIAWALFAMIFVFTLMQFRRQRAEAQGV